MFSVLPASVAHELRHRRPVPAVRHSNVTLLFSGIVGFSEFCADNADNHNAMNIVQLLNSVYTVFDELLSSDVDCNVYKVSVDYICIYAIIKLNIFTKSPSVLSVIPGIFRSIFYVTFPKKFILIIILGM